MKTLIITSLLSFIILIGKSQSLYKNPIIIKDNNGIITSVDYTDYNTGLSTSLPANAEVFFERILEVSADDHFVKTQNKKSDLEESSEHFEQYYKGLLVEGGGYNFHYRGGKIYFAHGHYVKINNLDCQPSLSPESAVLTFANFKKIPLDQISDNKTILIISEIPSSDGLDNQYIPMLVYQIRLYTNDVNNNEIGYIDAHTGEIVMTSSIGSNFSANGTFETPPLSVVFHKKTMAIRSLFATA